MFVRRAFLLTMLLSHAALAQDEAPPPPDEKATIPVLVETHGKAVAIDGELCRASKCEMRVRPGAHTVAIQVNTNGEFVDEHSQTMDISSPMVISAEGPGLLRQIALVTAVTGGAILLASVIVPLSVCGTRLETDPTTGIVRDRDPCRDISDGVKLGYIAGVGIGITLTLLGLIGLMGSPPPALKAKPWAVIPTIRPNAFGLALTKTF